ncbi:permease prefix domain 1-containing protein [Actinomadura rifamycini]|uniref:permease prefix domain 1-containing protein n=1 Tax=Actinomadura rifamycini TaxID=31962 RepID=UPI00040C4B45|nr:permease prefix domain 1-containing protein [Actinomadura rifamycini]
MIIDEHVGALSAALHGPARAKARMLDEARAGLADAADDLAATGLPAADAARRAVRDFGTVADVAPDFQRELTIAQARRTALAVALSAPVLLLCWQLAGTGGGVLPHAARLVGAVAAAAALLGAGGLAATGAWARRMPVPSGLPRTVAWAGTVSGAALGASAVALTAASALSADWPLAAAIAALTLVSHTKVAASARACRHCARLA